MKILGFTIGKEKPVTFNEFRDIVRLAVRRENPGARLEPRDDGFILFREGESPITCNIKQLYHNYYKSPANRDVLISAWIGSLTFETPKHSWSEASITLRPTLKNKRFVDAANKSLAKQEDSLPAQLFIEDLFVIIMRDLPGTAVAVTQSMLDEWGVTIEQCMSEALNNMGILQFPDVTNSLMSGSGKKGMPQEEVGVVIKGDHLTATWIISDRFRDYLGQRLQGDYVVTIPNRSQLTAVRADEPGLIASIQSGARNFASQPYPLSGQLFSVAFTTTGGTVTLYQPASLASGPTLDPASRFAAGKSAGVPNIANIAEAPLPPVVQQPKALNEWYGLTESTGDDPTPMSSTPPIVKSARKR